MCAILARKNPEITYSLVDINDTLAGYGEFRNLLPQMRKCIPSTSEEYKKMSYDFVFIDADHSYDASMTDFQNLGKYAKHLTVFHDIYAHEYDNENGGIARTWREVVALTPEQKHIVFSDYPDEWMGIGVVEW